MGTITRDNLRRIDPGSGRAGDGALSLASPFRLLAIHNGF
jgi:hypothetical protein